MKASYIALTLVAFLAACSLWCARPAIATDEDSPKMTGKWNLQLYVERGGVGIPMRDATLTITEQTINVTLTQINVDGKPVGEIRREFQYTQADKADPSMIDVQSNDNGASSSWQGRIKIHSDELILHLVPWNKNSETTRPKELFDFSQTEKGLLLLAATRDDEASSKEDSKSARGEWEVKRIVRNGEDLPMLPAQSAFLGKWTIMRELVLLDNLHPLTGNRQVAFFLCEFDMKSNPNRLSLWQPGNGRIQQGEWLSIYKIDGNKLTVCSNGMNRDQQGWPTEFESKGNSPNSVLYTFERVKSVVGR